MLLTDSIQTRFWRHKAQETRRALRALVYLYESGLPGKPTSQQLTNEELLAF